jgi:hypothetical protein
MRILGLEDLAASPAQSLHNLFPGGADLQAAILLDLLAKRSQIAQPGSPLSRCLDKLREDGDGLSLLFLGQCL